MMEKTPMKKEQEEDVDDINVNVLNFNHLHVTEPIYKRTIEGSPLISNNRKRIDNKKTPDIRLNPTNDSYDERGKGGFHTTTPGKGIAFPSPPLTPETDINTESNTPVSLTLSSSKTTRPDTLSSSRTTRPDQPEKVFVITSESGSSAQHNTTPGHQENAKRTALLSGSEQTPGCLHRDYVKDSLIWASNFNITSHPASIADILRVHEYSYIQHIINKCQQVSGEKSNTEQGIPFFYSPGGNLDCDTPLSEDSLNAARNFCGAAVRAVDVILDNKTYSESFDPVHKAFVIGRPPGHHAGPNGCVPSEHFWIRPDMTSSGFCLLNTVAVAASYARYNYSIIEQALSPNHILSSSTCTSTQIKRRFTRGHPPGSRPLRVAIVDIDVHHGNGTEEIVRNLSPHMTFLPLPSSWAPVGNITYKPWLNEKDAEEVCFASINLFADDRFYPGSGGDSSFSKSVVTGNGTDRNIVNIAMTPLGPGPWDPPGRLKLTAKQRQALCKKASQELREKVSQYLLPKLQEFSADLLIFSSGFDAHHDDLYHFLTEEDFHWLTKVIMTACSGGETPRCHNCRVLSVLEGGYSLHESAPTNQGKKSTRKGGSKSSPSVEADTSQRAHPFAVLPGDGGLVKGVLAHIAALANTEAWVKDSPVDNSW